MKRSKRSKRRRKYNYISHSVPTVLDLGLAHRGLDLNRVKNINTNRNTKKNAVTPGKPNVTPGPETEITVTEEIEITIAAETISIETIGVEIIATEKTGETISQATKRMTRRTRSSVLMRYLCPYLHKLPCRLSLGSEDKGKGLVRL